MFTGLRKFDGFRIVLFFTALTVVLTWLVIFTYEHYLRRPFYVWVEAHYSEDRTLQDQIEQRVEHFFISTTVDVIVVTLLLRLISAQQRKLRDSEERYRSLFEHASDGIGVVAAANHHIVDANRRFSEIFGYQRQSIRGKHVCDLFRQEEDLSEHGLLAEVFNCDSLEPVGTESGEPPEVEMTVRTTSGRALIVSASCNRLHTGKEKLYILILRDRTERKRLELEQDEMRRRLFQTSKLASLGELNRRIGAMGAYVVSLDLENQRFTPVSQWLAVD